MEKNGRELCREQRNMEEKGNTKEAIREIVEEIAVDHGTYGPEAEDRANALLEKLTDVDADAGRRWKAILECWRSPGLGKPVHYDVLPDGLPETEELCLIVLGFQLNPDGTMRDELRGRLGVALNSARKYPKAYVLCTGGGTASEDPSATEAGVMAKWLAEQGVEENRIIVEDRSLTTAQNAIFSREILLSCFPSVKQLAVVSSDYHVATGELLFRAEAILRAEDPGNAMPEVVANAAYRSSHAPLSAMFQAGALIELNGDAETAYKIYYDTYDINALPPLH